MSNPKTVPSAGKPEAQNGWVRKCELDAYLDRNLPIPTQVVSLLDAFGPDHVLWGTDSIWWGSPYWQIEAMRRLEMPESLMKQFGYAPLTTEVKAKIFGLNAARIYGVDPKAKRNPVPGDYVDRLKKLYKQSGMALPSNTQYGWVRA